MPWRSTVTEAVPRLSSSLGRIPPPTRASISLTSAALADTTEYLASLTTVLGNSVSLLRIAAYYNLLSDPAKALEGFTESLDKELVQSWNIKASIIEPGGFETRWSGDLHQHPPPQAYSTSDTPTNQFRSMHADTGVMNTGNPAKAAAALIKLSHVPAHELPIRIQLGSDAWTIVKTKAEATIRDGVKWNEISHSTNNDGVDKDAIIKLMGSVVR